MSKKAVRAVIAVAGTFTIVATATGLAACNKQGEDISESVTELSNEDVQKMLETANTTEIGKDFFAKFPNLTSITIPASVTKIDPQAFAKMPGLTNITVDSENQTYTSICKKAATTSSKKAEKKQGNFIAEKAGQGLRIVVGTTLDGLEGTNVHEIGDHAFAGRKMPKIIIPEGITKVGNFAFDGSTATSINISATVKNISDSAFANCGNVTSIVVDGENEYYTSQNKGQECNTLMTKTADAGVVEIIRGTVDVETITTDVARTDEEGNEVKDEEGNTVYETETYGRARIPSDATIVGPYAYSGCSQINEIDMFNSNITKVEDGAFAGCTGVTYVAYPQGVKIVNLKALDPNCKYLETIVVGTNNPDFFIKGGNDASALFSNNALTVFVPDASEEDVNNVVEELKTSGVELNVNSEIVSFVSTELKGENEGSSSTVVTDDTTSDTAVDNGSAATEDDGRVWNEDHTQYTITIDGAVKTFDAEGNVITEDYEKQGK